MPRSVRNFWIEAEIDGAQSTIEGGPRSKDGGFTLTVYMRSKGKVTTAVEMQGQVDDNSKLTLDMVGDGFVHSVTTQR